MGGSDWGTMDFLDDFTTVPGHTIQRGHYWNLSCFCNLKIPHRLLWIRVTWFSKSLFVSSEQLILKRTSVTSTIFHLPQQYFTACTDWSLVDFLSTYMWTLWYALASIVLSQPQYPSQTVVTEICGIFYPYKYSLRVLTPNYSLVTPTVSLSSLSVTGYDRGLMDFLHPYPCILEYSCQIWHTNCFHLLKISVHLSGWNDRISGLPQYLHMNTGILPPYSALQIPTSHRLKQMF